ncbi:ABC transporter C-terminal domain-containing protein, partial [Trichocoleus sp. ST-U1]
EAANAKDSSKSAPPQVRPAEPQPSSNNNNKRRRLSTWEKREFEKLEGKIAQLETEKAEAERALYNAAPGKVAQVGELYQKVETLTQAIDAATERWMELAEIES